MTATFSRRTTLALIASAAVLAGCARASSGSILKVGCQKGSTKAMMLASHALDGANFSIEWSEFPAAQTLLEAIGSGAVDVGLVGDAPFQFAYQSGSPIRAVGAQLVSPRPREALAIIVPKESPARDINGLRGKSIATTRGSVGHYLVLRALDAANLPASAVRLTFLSPGDAKAAFSSGSIDAWSTWIPYLTAALDEGARVVADGADFVRGYGFEVANLTAITEKRTLIADFLKREATALQWTATHRDDYARVLATETGLPLPIARTMVTKNSRLRVPIDTPLIADQQIVIDTFRKLGAIRGDRPVAGGFATNF